MPVRTSVKRLSADLKSQLGGWLASGDYDLNQAESLGIPAHGPENPMDDVLIVAIACKHGEIDGRATEKIREGRHYPNNWD